MVDRRYKQSKKEWNIIGFVDDNESVQNTELNGYKVVGNSDWLKEQNYHVVNAVADPLIKKIIMEKLATSSNKFPALVHPNVICSDTSVIGQGSIICAGTIITVNVTIGDHVILNLDVTIGHDAIIGDYTTVLPSVNISGYVETEECVSVGTGSAVIQGVYIGKNTVIGPGL